MKSTILLILLSISVAIGQEAFNNPNNSPRCYFDEYETMRLGGQKLHYLDRNISQKNSSKATLSDSIYRIPVVVHVIHNGGTENISLAKIQSQIDIMNEDFRKIAGTPGFGNGVDTRIEFFLAQKDPQGNCTDGVVRIQSSLTNSSIGNSAALKALSQWEPLKYLNVWVVRSISGGILGYATGPFGLNPNPNSNPSDGIVVGYNYFGTLPPISTPYHLGRTATHEVGHWLGLPHTFFGSGGCSNRGQFDSNCAFQGDGFCDTPPLNAPNFGCSATPSNSCFDSLAVFNYIDQPDQVSNYMDYSDDICFDMFSQDQTTLMNSVLDNERAQLVDSINLVETGYYGCFGGHIYTSSNSICEGRSVDITFNLGGVPPFAVYYSEGGNPMVLNGLQGTYQFTRNPVSTITYSLDSMVDSTGAVAVINKSETVTVNPNPTADFTFTQNGLSVDFQDNSTGANSVLWIFGDGSVGTGSSVNHIYPSNGTYNAQVVANGNAGCRDTAEESISVISGLLDFGNTSKLKLQPNPTTSSIVVNIKDLKLNGEFEFIVYSITGKEEIVKEGIRRSDSGSFKINLQDLESGIYLIRVIDPSGDSHSMKIQKI